MTLRSLRPLLWPGCRNEKEYRNLYSYVVNFCEFMDNIMMLLMLNVCLDNARCWFLHAIRCECLCGIWCEVCMIFDAIWDLNKMTGSKYLLPLVDAQLQACSCTGETHWLWHNLCNVWSSFCVDSELVSLLVSAIVDSSLAALLSVTHCGKLWPACFMPCSKYSFSTHLTYYKAVTVVLVITWYYKLSLTHPLACATVTVDCRCLPFNWHQSPSSAVILSLNSLQTANRL